jgi:hypothetical protein
MPRGTSRYDETVLQQRLWTPNAIQNSLEVWLDADLVASRTIATGISSWKDQSLNNNDAFQNTAANQPTIVSRGIGNRTVFNFNGTSQLLNFTSTPFSGKTSGMIFVVFTVVNDPGLGIDYSTPPWGNSGTDTQVDHWPWTDGNIYDGTLSTTRKTAGDPVPSLKDGTLSTIYSASSDWRLWINGSLLFSTTSNTFTVGTSYIGYQTKGSFQPYFQGTIAEIVALKSTYNYRQQIEGYLAWKWGLQAKLPAEHSFVLRPPMIGD